MVGVHRAPEVRRPLGQRFGDLVSAPLSWVLALVVAMAGGALLGLIPATISPYVIRAISERASRRYFLTAERFDAQEARRIGLVHEVVTEDQLDHEVDKLVHSLLACSPHAVDEAKRLVRDVSGEAIEPALITETVRRIAQIRVSDEGREGVQAFLNKRKPSWLTDSVPDAQQDSPPKPPHAP